jgi:acetolactate synthase-1/2/3 large subunit
VAEAYLAALAQRGVEWLFSNAGTDFAPLIEALARASGGAFAAPRAVAVPHEVVAVGMAHGYWMVTGRPQAVMVHVDVGVANALVGVMNAARARAPLLFTSGRTPFTESGHRGGRDLPIHWGQEMRDQGALVREHVKWEHELVFGDQVELVVDRALAIANATPRGPVYLSLPRETLAQPWGDAALSSMPSQNVPSAARPDPAAIELAAELLAAARRPLIISAAFKIGAGGVRAAFADRFAIPVIEQWSPTNALGTDHPMHAGFDPGELLGEADVVLVLDVPVPWVPSRQRPAAGAAVIQVGPDPNFVDLPLRGHPATLAITSGVEPALEALGAALDRRLRNDPSAAQMHPGASGATASAVAAPLRPRHDEMSRRIAAMRERRRARAGSLDRPPAAAATKAWISRHLDRALAAELASGGAWLFHELGCDPSVMTFPKADTLFGLSIAGALGWALPAALGAQLAARDQLVVAAVGDGSYTFANPVACHQIAARLELPVLTVVFDNQGWQAVRMATLAIYPQGQAAQAEQMPLTSLAPSPDYSKVIEASGGWGEKVDDPTGFPAAIARALDVVRRERRQALVQVRLPLG